MKLNLLKRTLTATALLSLLTANTVLGADVPVDTTRLSPDLVSLGKLVQSDVDDHVMLTFIQNSPPKRNPTAEELVYLHELGLSSEAMVALLNAVPKVSLTETTPAPPRIVQPLLAQREYQPGGTVQSAPSPEPAQSASFSGNTVISSPAPTVVYTQPAPTTIYVEQPPVVTYVEPIRPRFSFGLSFGHVFGHHGGHWGHHRSHHWGGHHGGHWGYRGHRGHHGRHH